jgi:hypothetical protein
MRSGSNRAWWKRSVDRRFHRDLLGFDERSDFGDGPSNQRIKVNGLEFVIQHPASNFDRSNSELTTPISRLLSSARIVKSFLCLSVVSPPTPSNNRPVPSLIEVKGVRNSWDMEEKKSPFTRSISPRLSHMQLKAAANSAISGGELMRSPASKRPSAMSRVLLLSSATGRVTLRVISSDRKTMAIRHGCDRDRDLQGLIDRLSQ